MTPQAIATITKWGVKAGKLFGSIAKGAEALDSAFVKFADSIAKVDAKINKLLNFHNSWTKIQDIAFKNARSLAMTRGEAMKYTRSLIQEQMELGRAYGTNSSEISQITKGHVEATGRNVRLSTEQTEAMLMMSRATDPATMQELTTEMDKFGVGVKASAGYLVQIQERAKRHGLSAAKASKDFASNLKQASTYSFANGLKDIQKMTLEGQRLKITMQDALAAADNMDTIEGAINTSARVQMLGGPFASVFGNNPMANLYESMADPAKMQEKIQEVVKGMATYQRSTGEAIISPVDVRRMKEFAKATGINVENLMNSARAQAQDRYINEEINRGGLSFAQTAGKTGIEKEQAEAYANTIRDLSRNNVDQQGNHFVVVQDEDGIKREVRVDQLTEEQVQILQDQQLTEKGLYEDVQEIKDELLKYFKGRTVGTMSAEENLEGMRHQYEAGKARGEHGVADGASGVINGENGWVTKAVNWAFRKVGDFVEGVTNLFGFTSGNKEGFNNYENGGIVKANGGAIIPGNNYYGDNVPVFANSGEMVINRNQQGGLFNLLSNLPSVMASMWAGNKIGGKLGLGKLGYAGAFLSATDKDTSMTEGLAQAYIMRKFGRVTGMVSGVDPITAMLMGGKSKKTENTKPSRLTKILRGGKYQDESGVWRNRKGNVTKMPRIDAVTTKFNNSLESIRKQLVKTFPQASKVVGKFSRGLAKININNGLNLLAKRFPETTKELTGAYKELSSVYHKKVDKVKSTSKNAVKKVVSKPIKHVKTLVNKVASPISKFGRSVAGNISKNALKYASGLKQASRIIPGLGTIVTAGFGVYEGAMANKKYKNVEKSVNASNLSNEEKNRVLKNAKRDRNASYGGAAGGVAGTLAGAAAGAKIGAVAGTFLGGPIGTGVGAFLGSVVGGIGGYVAGKKLGKTVGKSIEPSISKVKSDAKEIQRSSNNIAKSSVNKIKEKETAVAKNNSTVKAELRRTDSQRLMEFSRITGSKNLPEISIKRLEELGLKPLEIESTTVSPTLQIGGTPNVPYQGYQYRETYEMDGNGKNGQYNLDVSGVIKLDIAGLSASISASDLINNTEFKRQITEQIANRMNNIGNAGKYNRESNYINMQKQYNRI